MRKTLIILTLILFACEFIHAQCTLEIGIKDCREENSIIHLSEFEVFRNDTLIKTVQPKQINQHKLKDLDYGSYRIEYRTIFGKIESVTIELSEKLKYRVDLCLNYIDHESDLHKPFIDQLKDGESYSIQVYSQGCFHSSDETISVKRELDSYLLIYGDKKKLLDNNEIAVIRCFEIELNYATDIGCTTTEIYIMKYNDHEVSMLDGGCKWNGAYHLKKNLNLIAD